MPTSTEQRSRPARFQRFSGTPKGFALYALVVMALLSIVVKHDTKSLLMVCVSMATGLLCDLVVGQFYKKKRFFSDGGLITGMIVGMVLGSFTPWYVAAATVAIAIASKHVLRIKRKPIFNPAAVGLLIANYAFASMQSWWGGMSLVSYWYLIPLVIAGIIVARRAKKLPAAISFMIAYLVMCFIFWLLPGTRMAASFGFQNPMINAAVFLAFFMLTDPPTSPAKGFHQTWFGASVGVISVAIYLVFPAELSYLLIALLVANGAKAIQSVWVKRGSKAVRTSGKASYSS